MENFGIYWNNKESEVEIYHWACTICQENIIWINGKTIMSFNTSSNCIALSFDTLTQRNKITVIWHQNMDHEYRINLLS